MSRGADWECSKHGTDYADDCYLCYEASKGPEVRDAEARAEIAAENAWLAYAERPDFEDESYRVL